MKLLILNGPNLNFLGIREPAIYGKETYEDLLALIRLHAEKRGVAVSFYQSNHEGDLVDAIQKAYFDKIDGIVFNPGAYTHTSIAIADAVKAVGIPTVEVHISNVKEREPFRQVSYIGLVATASVIGEGLQGYLHAMDILIDNA
ncbi:MAG: type II 3-dehydroquinate dehydratase [Clostridia bacterium]|nr:type II 3-dehydroquinate dehydratase [Clostridia bacterium]